jgi:nucleotide-binding universal stress UspA family protein
MNDSKTILVPIDFEDASIQAVAQARELGARLGAEVVLLHVYAVPATMYPALSLIADPDLDEEIRVATSHTLERFAGENGQLRTLLRCGDPTTETLAAIEETHPEMVVMGTHARTGLAHFLLGSVAENVIRKSTVPILTLRAAMH